MHPLINEICNYKTATNNDSDYKSNDFKCCPRFLIEPLVVDVY